MIVQFNVSNLRYRALSLFLARSRGQERLIARVHSFIALRDKVVISVGQPAWIIGNLCVFLASV